MKRPLIYRIGDMVLFKKSGGSRRRRSKWVPVEVCDVHRGGMYGETTYSVWLLESRRMIDYVRTDELRFKHHYDLQRRLRDDEIARYNDEARNMNISYSHTQRGRGFRRGDRMDRFGVGRGRSGRTARAWQPRARSADGNFHLSPQRNHQRERAVSVPPENTNWPVFLAEFAKATYRDHLADRDNIGDDPQFNNADHEGPNYSRDVRHGEYNRIDENEYDYRDRGDYYRLVDDANRGGDYIDDRLESKELYVERSPPPRDDYMVDRRGTYAMNVKDGAPRGDIHMKFVFPGCRGLKDRDA